MSQKLVSSLAGRLGIFYQDKYLFCFTYNFSKCHSIQFLKILLNFTVVSQVVQRTKYWCQRYINENRQKFLGKKMILTEPILEKKNEKWSLITL